MTTATVPRARWAVLVVAIACLVAVPLAAIAVEVLASGAPALPRGIGAMVLTTLVLLVAVALGTLVVGGGLAWLVSAHTFPGRDVMAWLLVLPLAMPAYILGFVFLSVFDVAGPVQSGLRALLGDGVWLPDVRSTSGAVVVLVLTLYPYVYLLARAALVEQMPSTYDAARTLGASRSRVLRRVVLPLARPSLAAGLALVMMETLTDFATVQYFGVRTVSVGVYLTWKGSFDFASATQLSLLVLAFAVAVLVGERVLRGRARYHQRGRSGRGVERVALPGLRGWAALAACLLVLALGFGLPVGQLLAWAVADLGSGGTTLADPRFAEYVGNSLTVAVVVAVVCVLLALLVSHSLRLGGGRVVRAAAQVTTIGYAVPGAVVGIGVLLAVAALDDAAGLVGLSTGLLATGSVLGILYAYVVRFLAPAYQAVDASFAKLSPNLTASALSLGAGPARVLRRVHGPLVRPGVAVALMLVMIDAIKELPLVLLLRPFGFSTVSVWVYELASENFWTEAGLPALVIVAVATLPVVVLFRQVRQSEGGRS